jgi:hypothetical protein
MEKATTLFDLTLPTELNEWKKFDQYSALLNKDWIDITVHELYKICSFDIYPASTTGELLSLFSGRYIAIMLKKY